MDNFGKEAVSIEVGARLRQLRQERGVSMRTLARESGLSANALSMIERSITSPSVSTLSKLANAMEVPITAFFRNEPQRERVVFRKASERSRVPFMRGLWEDLGGESFSGRLEAFMLTLESGGSSGPHGMVHSGNEFVFVLRGQLDYEVENNRYNLETGDSLMFASQMNHRWRNPGRTVTNALILICAFAEDEHPGSFHLSVRSEPKEE